MEQESSPIRIFNAKDDAARHVADRFQAWSDSMQKKRDTWARLDKRYHNYRDDLDVTPDRATAEPRANIGVPLAAETVDTAVAQIYANLLGQRPYGGVRGREYGDSLKAEVVQQVMDWQFEVVNFPEVAHRIFHDAVKYGVSPCKLHFRRETRRFPEQLTIAGIPIPGVTRMAEKVTAMTPVPEHRPVQDVFYPMDAPDIDCAEGIIDRRWQTRRQIRLAKDGLGLPLYDLAALSRVKSSQSSKDTDPRLSKEYTTRKIEDGGLERDGKMALLEYTGKLPEDVADALVRDFYPNANPDGDWIVAIVDGSLEPLRVEPSPYLHDKRMWVMAKVIEDPGYICGISIIEFVEKLGLTIDELYNIVMDNMNRSINGMFYVNERAGIDEADLVSRPGHFIRGKLPPQDAIRVMEHPEISQAVFIIINGLLNHYKEYTGITNLRLGQAEGGRQTATEIASLMTHSQTRLGQFERKLEATFMRPLFERWTLLNQQFMDQSFTIRVFKDSQYAYPMVAPEDMQGLFDFVFEGSTRADTTALEIGQNMQLLQMDATQPVFIFNHAELGLDILRQMKKAEPERFLNPMFGQEYMAYRQMQMLQMAGETARAVTPDQQAQSKTQAGAKAGQGKAAPGNASAAKDFKSALAGVVENTLPQMPTEG